MIPSHTPLEWAGSHGTDAEQDSLFVAPEVPLQLRLDARTRRLGLAHVASLKVQLAEQAARRLARTAPQADHPRAA